MRPLCDLLEIGNKQSEKQEYLSIFSNSKKWYLEQYADYQHKLQADLLPAFCDAFREAQESVAIEGFNENFKAKQNLFNVADILSKLMLSVYTYGPDTTIPVEFNGRSGSGSWLSSDLNALEITELLQLQLEAHNEGQRINLSVLVENRTVRSALTHRGKIVVCGSAIRCYNIIREMLVFMEPECASELPCFSYPELIACDTQGLMQSLMDFRFGEDSTLLVVNSLRDIPLEAQRLLANLPWTLVIDLDGYSLFGGLRSMVEHGNINDQQLTESTANSFRARKGYTTWYTCGDFCNFTYTLNTSRKIHFNTKAPFSENYRQIKQRLDRCLDSITQTLFAQLRTMHIFFLSSNQCNFAEKLIEKCEYNCGNLPYTFVTAYYEPQEAWNAIRDDLNRAYASDPDNQPFSSFSCDLKSLFDGLCAYQNAFPQRSSTNSPHRLPSNDGITEITNNLALNLSDYFDVLYADVGAVPQEQFIVERDEFCHGGLPAWSVFQNQVALPLLRKTDFERHIGKIKDRLKALPKERSKKVLHLTHTPGIGGSTLLRQIGWELHNDYPVLLAQRYDVNVKGMIQQLYDDRKKGILILADETLNDYERLKSDIVTLDRACVLIVAGRQMGQGVRNGESIEFNVITVDGERALRQQFKQYSQLNPELLEQKDADYDTIFKAGSEMRNPFMIGLYYQESDFHGVRDYVRQLMNVVHEERELKAVTLLALCDYYGQIGLPKILIDRYLGIPARSDYFKSCPYAKSVFLTARGFDDNVEIYRSKHYLLSQELLEQCSIRLYGSTLDSSLSDLSFLLIDTIYNEYCSKPSHTYHEILERLFIDKSSDQEQFSPLIMSLSAAMYRRQVMKYLSEKFEVLTRDTTPEVSEELYRMVAHFYGHLGRICMNHNYGTDNPSDAAIYCQKSVSFMEQSAHGSPDPRIYHMWGEAKRILLSKELDEAEACPSAEQFEVYENTIDEISEIFDKTAQYGSIDYALVSKVKMYIHYLKRVYKWKLIDKPEDINQLSMQQASYRAEIENLFEQAYDLDFSDSASEQLRKLEDDYRINILGGSFGSAIQYYENLINNLSRVNGRDLELQDAKRGLITARLARYYNISKNEHGYHAIKPDELRKILDLLEDVMGQTIDIRSYQQRNQRIAAYDRWFHLAKMKGSGRTLDKALHYADHWIGIDQQVNGYDPRPYYYRYVLSMLCLLDGNSVEVNRMEEDRRTCYNNAQNRNNHYQIYKLRDILVSGTGLERLFDIRFAGKDLSAYLNAANVSPITFEGIFDRISADKGYIKLRSPSNWAGKEVKFTLGRSSRVNSISENQQTHILEAFAGFTYEQLSAIDMYVKDYTGKEGYPKLKKASTAPRVQEVYSFDVGSLNQKRGKVFIFTPQKVTSNRGLSGIISIERRSYPATLQKGCVSAEMCKQVSAGKAEPIKAVVSRIDESTQRIILSLPKH